MSAHAMYSSADVALQAWCFFFPLFGMSWIWTIRSIKSLANISIQTSLSSEKRRPLLDINAPVALVTTCCRWMLKHFTPWLLLYRLLCPHIIHNFRSLITLTPRFFLRIQLKLSQHIPRVDYFSSFAHSRFIAIWRQSKRHPNTTHLTRVLS